MLDTYLKSLPAHNSPLKCITNQTDLRLTIKQISWLNFHIIFKHFFYVSLGSEYWFKFKITIALLGANTCNLRLPKFPWYLIMLAITAGTGYKWQILTPGVFTFPVVFYLFQKLVTYYVPHSEIAIFESNRILIFMTLTAAIIVFNGIVWWHSWTFDVGVKWCDHTSAITLHLQWHLYLSKQATRKPWPSARFKIGI